MSKALQIEEPCRAARAVISKAVIVFGDADKGRRWLASDNLNLVTSPSSLLASRDGRRRVYEELLRINYCNFT